MKPQDFVLLIYCSPALAAPSADRGPRQKFAPGFRVGGRRKIRPGSGNGPHNTPGPGLLNPEDRGGCEIPPLDIEVYCAPPVKLDISALNTYVCGDWRLGPVKLPTIPSMLSLDPFTEFYHCSGPSCPLKLPSKMIRLGSLVEFYHRFGALCPTDFISKYWDPNGLPTPYWHFPPHNGFSLDTDGDPITGNITLEVGVLVDRFGSESGRFVSPATAPYIQRALPPNNLDTLQDNPLVPYGYHLYRVAKTFNVEAGLIAPWFEQPGQGVQYHLPDDKTVKDLVDSGHLVAEDPRDLYSLGRDG